MASLNSVLWLELKTNKNNVIDILDCFIDNIVKLKDIIINDDDEKLLEEFKCANKRRRVGIMQIQLNITTPI